MKVLIIDDHQLYLEGMTTVLSTIFPESSIFSANKISGAFDILTRHSDMDIILLDIRMPNGGAPVVLKQLRQESYLAPVLVVSASENSADVHMSLTLGASGYLPKSASSTELKYAIEVILQGKEYLPAQWSDTLNSTQNINVNNGEENVSISPRLYEVLQLIEKGCTTSEISILLELSPHTVKGYISQLFSRFNVHNRTELIQTARQLHFFSLRS